MSTTYTDLTNTTFPDIIQRFRNANSSTGAAQWADLAQGDSDNYLTYMQKLAAGSTSEAKEALQLITDYEKKIITASDFNMICDTILAVEQFYNDAENGTGAFETILAQFVYMGTWNSATPYKRFNLINYNSATYGSGIYIALQNNTNVAPTDLTSDTNWKKISTSNVANVGTTWLGNWTSGNYSEGSLVSHNNQWWLCNANTNTEPSENATDWDSIIDFTTYKPVVSSTAPEEQIAGDFWYHIL